MSLLYEALRDLSEMVLGCKSCSFGGTDLTEPSPVTETFMGGLVRLSGTSTALHVGLLATPAHCSGLARRLLGQVADTNLPESLVRGAMCELAYLLAGGVRRRLRFAAPLSVGQPAFFQGAVEHRAGWETRLQKVELDAMSATLVSVAPSQSLLRL